MKLKMKKDQAWMIRKQIRSFRGEKIYTSEQVGDDNIVNSMLELGYAEEVSDEGSDVKAIKDYENKVLEPEENKVLEPEENKSIDEKPGKGKNSKKKK